MVLEKGGESGDEKSRDGHQSHKISTKSMRGLLLTYAQKTPVSPLRLIQDPGWGFVLEIGMVSHHHRLSLRQLVARERRLVVFWR